MGPWLHRLANYFVILGGIMLCAMALLVVVSVSGRVLFLRPVPGDFEIVGLGTAIAIFLMLPYCHLQRGNVTVDLFLARAPARLRAILDALAGIVFGVIALAFTWRMIFGLGDMWRQGDITMIVGLPLWWVFPFGIVSFALLALCCFYTAICDLKGRTA